LTGLLPQGLSFKLLHMGIAVPELNAAATALESLLGYRIVSGPFDDPIQKVSVNFLAQASQDFAELELIAPLTEDSPVHSMLKKTGGGAYHLCYETNDLEAALTHMKEQKCLIASAPAPAVAFEGRRIAWLYTPNRLLVELVEA